MLNDIYFSSISLFKTIDPPKLKVVCKKAFHSTLSALYWPHCREKKIKNSLSKYSAVFMTELYKHMKFKTGT